MRSLAVAVLFASLAPIPVSALAETLPEHPIVNEGGLAEHWTLADPASIVAPAYPAEYDDENRPDACVALQYTVYPDGTTGDFRVVRTWKSGPVSKTEMRPFWLKFARAGVAAVGQWRFAPRDPANATPMTSVATLSFFGNTVASAEALRAHCKITDLAVLLRSFERRDTLITMDLERKSREMDEKRRRGVGGG
jgi:hypothetical protein